MNKRYFTSNNLHKIDGLLYWLFDKKHVYCISWSVDREKETGDVIGPRAVVGWYE